MNKGNVRRRAKRTDIENPASLTEEEIQDALRYCRIRASELKKQAKSLRKTYLRNYLIVAQEKKDKESARATKQKIDKEENAKMWTNIKYVVRDPRSSQVLRVQRLEHGEVCEYTSKGDIEKWSKKSMKLDLPLPAHNAPIMKHSLAGKLRYLEDEDVARAIVDGTYEIPPELDEATKFILQETG